MSWLRHRLEARRVRKERREARLCLDCGWPLNPGGVAVVCWPVRGYTPRPACVRQYASVRHPFADRPLPAPPSSRPATPRRRAS